MWACWHSEVPYNPNIHGAERRIREEIAA